MDAARPHGACHPWQRTRLVGAGTQRVNPLRASRGGYSRGLGGMSNPPFAGAGPTAGMSTRDRILRAANDLFARQGFSRVSMRMVAIAAGVTKPALYYYFRDKESLFEECLAEFNEQMEPTIRAATA